MNTRGNIGRGRVGASCGDNQVPPQGTIAEVAMQVNPVGLIDTNVRTAQHKIQVVLEDNAPTQNMANRLHELVGMNSPIFKGSRTLEDSQVFVEEV